MPFFYTDDAIVSGSPTGRHLSTVIKRPVVLMSGWDEHAAAVCKVLNGLQPDHPLSGEYMDLTFPCGETIRATPFEPDFSALEGRAAYTLRTANPGGSYTLKSVPAGEAAPLLFEALKDRDAKLAAVTAELEELQAKPVEVTGALALSLVQASPGDLFFNLGNAHTFKRV